MAPSKSKLERGWKRLFLSTLFPTGPCKKPSSPVTEKFLLNVHCINLIISKLKLMSFRKATKPLTLDVH